MKVFVIVDFFTLLGYQKTILGNVNTAIFLDFTTILIYREHGTIKKQIYA